MSFSVPQKKANLALKKTLQLHTVIMGSNGDVFHLHLPKNNCMFFHKLWTSLSIHQTRERWSLGKKINGLKGVEI